MRFPPTLVPTALLGLLALAGCASHAASDGPARPQRVAWIDYRSGVRLELVNETHTGRVEQYSTTRKDASRKVQTDEVMSGLIEILHDQGFSERARPGPMPLGGDGQNVMALEIDDAGDVQHVVAWRGMPADDRTALLGMAQNFADLYNATYGLQAVEVGQDESPFENPVGPTKKKPAAEIQKAGD